MAYRRFGLAAQPGPAQLDLFAPIERPSAPVTAEKSIHDLVPLGTVVEASSHCTGPYIVTKVEAVPGMKGVYTFYMTKESLFIDDPSIRTLLPKSPWYFCMRTVVDGRIRRDGHDDFRDETFIRGFNERAAAMLRAAA